MQEDAPVSLEDQDNSLLTLQLSPSIPPAANLASATAKAPVTKVMLLACTATTLALLSGMGGSALHSANLRDVLQVTHLSMSMLHQLLCLGLASYGLVGR